MITIYQPLFLNILTQDLEDGELQTTFILLAIQIDENDYSLIFSDDFDQISGSLNNLILFTTSQDFAQDDINPEEYIDSFTPSLISLLLFTVKILGYEFPDVLCKKVTEKETLPYFLIRLQFPEVFDNNQIYHQIEYGCENIRTIYFKQ